MKIEEHGLNEDIEHGFKTMASKTHSPFLTVLVFEAAYIYVILFNFLIWALTSSSWTNSFFTTFIA